MLVDEFEEGEELRVVGAGTFGCILDLSSEFAIHQLLRPPGHFPKSGSPAPSRSRASARYSPCRAFRLCARARTNSSVREIEFSRFLEGGTRASSPVRRQTINSFQRTVCDGNQVTRKKLGIFSRRTGPGYVTFGPECDSDARGYGRCVRNFGRLVTPARGLHAFLLTNSGDVPIAEVVKSYYYPTLRTWPDGQQRKRQRPRKARQDGRTDQQDGQRLIRRSGRRPLAGWRSLQDHGRCPTR